MKKIINLTLFVLFAFFLVSCVDETSTIEHTINFINNGEIVETKKVANDELLEPFNLVMTANYTYQWYLDDKPYDFNLKVTKSFDLIANWSKVIGSDEYIFDIFYLNDTHGAVLKKDDELGLSYIGNYLKEEYKKNPEGSIFIGGGDMFQGQLISNDNKGALMVEIFNDLNMDAFVIGNHEFDWGLDIVLELFDSNTTGVKANFPILGANVKEKATNKRPDLIDSHTIIERKGFKIGIIGVIGDGLEGSISTLRVKDYYFSDAYEAVLETANEINDEVDFILVINHANNQFFNERVAAINKVSAIFNGHTHSTYDGLLLGRIPYIQSSSNAKRVGRINLEFDDDINLITGLARNISSDVNLDIADNVIESIINKYYEDMRHLYEDEILIASKYLSVNELANYIAKVMAEVTGSVAGFQNSGGTRSDIANGKAITAADIFQVFPFDNQILYTHVTGYQLKQLYDDSYFVRYDKLNYSQIDNNELYLVATNDYIFYSSYQQYAFLNKTPIVFGDMYETFYQVLINLKEEGYTHFDASLEVIWRD